ncbi:MAG: 50S ribosomal protein L29 [Bdellovibrionales bacterium]
MAKNVAKPADIRAKTEKELETRLAELRKEQFNLRFQRATGQLANTARVNHVRKEIARILTVVGERARGVAAPEKKTAKTAKSKSAKKPAA